MIKYIAFFILLIPCLAFGATALNLDFGKNEIKQGSIETAKILLKADAVQRVPLQKLKGQTLAETIYFYDVSPLMRKEGSDFFEAEAKVIFAKTPETNALGTKFGNEDLLVTWGNSQISPTEASKGFIFGKFEIPSRPKIILWLSIILGLGVLIFLVIWGRKKYQIKTARKKKMQDLKRELLGATNYQEVVEVWKKKHKFLDTFPQIEESFKGFETVLFKYQFKPRQNETEMAQVTEAYRDFVRKIEGGLNGI
ncbi:hypothetical protein [Peredibacter starrii]|uniref:Protein BatD n=1 Tax=Peredibacter starrii TaxID=28202 RepID=A0AAX4HR05_9BACT|nr:hypothetical protein [Peredibacter starrii]WPU65521.1 hypothetical protein SOO65_02050 [Peredibacter starrii]